MTAMAEGRSNCLMDESLSAHRPFRRLPGSAMLEGAIDSHVHCAPHINRRTVTVFDAVRDAAAVNMRALGIMDVFANTSGLASLAMRELGHLGVEVFGGIILEPYVGGISARSVETALGMGYDGRGARFVSLPCHHTRFIALSEHRSPAFIETTLAIPETGDLPGDIPEIIDLCVARGAVFNTGHLFGAEHMRVVAEAQRRGADRILVPASYLTVNEAVEIAGMGAILEFSFFVLGHATQVPQTMIDAEPHRFAIADLARMIEIIRKVGPGSVILSSDSGALVLPPPTEAMRELLVTIESCGIPEADIREMVTTTAARLFDITLP